MKRLNQLNYDGVPGIKESAKILIKAIIRKFYLLPGSIISSFMIELRFAKNERLIAKVYAKKNTRIPKILHYIWVGGAKKPNSVNLYIKSWKKHCPDYLVIEWNEKNYNIKQNRYTYEAYIQKKWAFATDFMRLDILDRFGGVYLDSDVEILKNLDHFLNNPAFTSFEAGRPDEILMPTGIMGAEVGNLWIKYLKSYYNNNRSFILSDGSIDITPNTDTITKMTQKKYRLRIDNTFQENNDFVIYPSDFFCPKSWSTGKIALTKNSHTIHHFAGSWQK